MCEVCNFKVTVILPKLWYKIFDFLCVQDNSGEPLMLKMGNKWYQLELHLLAKVFANDLTRNHSFSLMCIISKICQSKLRKNCLK